MTERHSEAKRKAWQDGVYAERVTYKGGSLRASGEPVNSRTQRHPLPEAAPVLAEAHRRRQAWQESMRKVSQSSRTEQDRAEAQEAVDNAASEGYTD